MGKHYLYQHTRLDTWEVFYIGIWTKERKYYTRANNVNKRSDLWKKIYNKAWWRNVEILFESDDYEDIKSKEKELISKLGKKCNDSWWLANLTDWWDGNLWRIPSKERNEKISKALKGKQPAHWNPMAGKKHTEEAKEKMKATSAKKRAEWYINHNLLRWWSWRKHTPETKEKLRQIKLTKI